MTNIENYQRYDYTKERYAFVRNQHILAIKFAEKVLTKQPVTAGRRPKFYKLYLPQGYEIAKTKIVKKKVQPLTIEPVEGKGDFIGKFTNPILDPFHD